MSLQKDLSWKLWDLSNVITAFAAAQSIAFSFGVSNDLLVGKISQLKVMLFMSIIIFIGGFFYVCAVNFCYRNSIKLESSTNDDKEMLYFKKVWRNSNRGRIIIVIFFTLFCECLIFSIHFGCF